MSQAAHFLPFLYILQAEVDPLRQTIVTTQQCRSRSWTSGQRITLARILPGTGQSRRVASVTLSTRCAQVCASHRHQTACCRVTGDSSERKSDCCPVMPHIVGLSRTHGTPHAAPGVEAYSSICFW